MQTLHDVIFSLNEIKEMNKKFIIDLMQSVEDEHGIRTVNIILSDFHLGMEAQKQIQFWCDNVSDGWWGEKGNQYVDNVLCELSTKGTIERVWVASKETEHKEETGMERLAKQLCDDQKMLKEVQDAQKESLEQLTREAMEEHKKNDGRTWEK